ncbi:hypothetical protein D3C80_1576640 [compost metagenome]
MGDFAPVLDLHAEEKGQNNRNTEIPHKGREGTKRSDHIFKKNNQPVRQDIGGICEIAVNFVGQIGREGINLLL